MQNCHCQRHCHPCNKKPHPSHYDFVSDCFKKCRFATGTSLPQFLAVRGPAASDSYAIHQLPLFSDLFHGDINSCFGRLICNITYITTAHCTETPCHHPAKGFYCIRHESAPDACARPVGRPALHRPSDGTPPTTCLTCLPSNDEAAAAALLHAQAW